MTEHDVANAVAIAQEEMHSLTERLPSIVAKLDELIEAREDELASLRTTRRSAAKMLILADSEWVDPQAGNRPGPKPRGSGTGKKHVGQQSVGRIRDWLEARRGQTFPESGDETFTATALTRHPEWNGLPAQSPTSAALNELRDAGFIQLDHMGTGGSKHYRMTA